MINKKDFSSLLFSWKRDDLLHCSYFNLIKIYPVCFQDALKVLKISQVVVEVIFSCKNKLPGNGVTLFK